MKYKRRDHPEEDRIKKKGRKTTKKTLSIVAAIVLTFTAGNALLANTLYASAESNSQITSEYDDPRDRDSSGRYDDSSSRVSSEYDDSRDVVSSGYEKPSSTVSTVENLEGSVTLDEQTGELTLSGKITKDQVKAY